MYCGFALVCNACKNIGHMQTHWACPKGRTLVDNCFVKTSHICYFMEIWRKSSVGLQLNVCQKWINTLGKYPLKPSRSTGNAAPCQMDPQESASQRFPACCFCYTWAKNYSTCRNDITVLPCKQRVYKLKAVSAKDQDNQQSTTWARLLHPYFHTDWHPPNLRLFHCKRRALQLVVAHRCRSESR